MIDMELISMVPTVGFPVISFAMMFFLVRDTIQKNTDALTLLRDQVMQCPRNPK